MDVHPFLLWIEAEEWPAGQWTPDDDVTEVVVTLPDGTRWIGSCCAFGHLATLRRTAPRPARTWAAATCGRRISCWSRTRPGATLEAVVRDLLARNELGTAFSELEADPA
jgi:hypothetical protein